LVDALNILGQPQFQDTDLISVGEKIISFSKYYERRIYQHRYSRLRVYLPVFHQLLHVAGALTWNGPMFVYSQWSMER
ncbi:hypothetical protein K440DRAFT_573153, partial [Wilcoxina mikolae CBS 423.85]